MPGIVGIVSDRPAADCRRLLCSMITSMRHEEFYTSGSYSVPDLGVYAGWVAHQASFSAGQPFVNETQDVVLLFSGECFIDPDERRTLTSNGHKCARNAADFLVHQYEEQGDQLFEKLNGLFSGLLIDQRQNKAFLFNDRYGVERIYFHERDGHFYFASEAKALLRILPELRKFDAEGVAQYLTLGCTLETRTLFRGITLLPGGSLWSFEGGKCHKRNYFSPQTWESQSPLSEKDFDSALEHTFKRILPRYFDAESRTGISLTSGLDSRMIMACLPKTEQQPICYTFSGQDGDTLDATLATEVANACDLDHQILRIGSDFFTDFAAHVDRTVYVTDGYLGSLGAHEIYFNRKAHSLASVRLTGVFGDEILRGRSMFKPLRFSRQLLNPVLEKSVSSLIFQKQRNNEHRVSFAAFREVPEKRFGVPAAARSQIIFRTPYLDNEIVALAYRVPENIRASARPVVSLINSKNGRLSRIPTDLGQLGNTNQAFAAVTRILSRASFKLDYFCSEGLPQRLSRLDPFFRWLNSRLGTMGQHKFLHYRSWFQRELAPYVRAVVRDARTRESPFFNSEFFEPMAVEHVRGHKNYMLEIDKVVTLEAIERLLFKDLPREHGQAGKEYNATAASPFGTASQASAV